MPTLLTYTNPIYSGYFADPFVWEHQGVYYAIGTSAAEAEGTTEPRVFPLLKSNDFVSWEFAGHALERPDPAIGNNFWAPEIAYSDGIFYLYYSVGHEDKNHQLRVATSRNPLGAYVDTGEPLLDPRACPFAIDPHPFQDDDGQWYLFYARDFLDAEPYRPGTALMVDRLVNMTRLANAGTVVLRARSDWQRFLKDRLMYGDIYDWHTLEGACVRKHGGHYYCFYSGGRWETEDYGVDYGIAKTVMGSYSDAGNERGARVLRSIPLRVIGPGHNSIVAAPNGDEYLVYHAWNLERSMRQICMDRLVWTEAGPRCRPTWTPQAIDFKTL